MLVIIMCLSSQLPSYGLLCTLLFSKPISPEIWHLHIFDQISSGPLDLFLALRSYESNCPFRVEFLIKQESQ